MPCSPVSVSSSTNSACRARLVESASLIGSQAQRRGTPRTAVIFMDYPSCLDSLYCLYCSRGLRTTAMCKLPELRPAVLAGCDRSADFAMQSCNFVSLHEIRNCIKLQYGFHIRFKTRNFSVYTKMQHGFPSPCLLPQNLASRILKPERKTPTHHKTWRYAI